MKSTDHAANLTMPVRLADRFEDLRTAYYARLGDDRSRLLKLRVQLGRAKSNPRGVYMDIRSVAHGMAGAAEVFEAERISMVAQSLEAAAIAALGAPGDEGGGAVKFALDSLTDLLHSFSA